MPLVGSLPLPNKQITTPEVPHRGASQESTPAVDRTTASSRGATEDDDTGLTTGNLAELSVMKKGSPTTLTGFGNGFSDSVEDPSPVIRIPNAIVKLAGVDLNKTAL